MGRNKVLQRRSQQRHYHANRENEIAKAKIRTQANREKLREVVRKAKSVPCTDCGGEWPSCVMDLHHLRDKDAVVGALIRSNVSSARLEAEIDKCIVLCANCHRIRTYCGVV